VRRRVVGVMGSGFEEHAHLAEPLGRWLASIGVNLLTGGGQGVMLSVSRAFASSQPRDGVVIGIIPSLADHPTHPKPGYPNAHVEIAVFTHLQSGDQVLSRNHVNVLSSDVVIALPGGEGTMSEISMALAYGRPVAVYLRQTTDMPGLPESVPVFTEIQAVQRFVLEHLG